MGASTFFGADASTSGGTNAGYVELIREARDKGLQVHSLIWQAPSLIWQASSLIWHAPSLTWQFPHAYSMLDFADVDGEQLVKLRNPNGHAGWRGAWGKGSPQWTYDLKQ
eukprot:7246285-Prymnesium_polylepis.1